MLNSQIHHIIILHSDNWDKCPLGTQFTNAHLILLYTVIGEEELFLSNCKHGLSMLCILPVAKF